MAPKKKIEKPQVAPVISKAPRPIPQHAGDVQKTCANCQHFAPETLRPKQGECHNGISGKIAQGTRAVDGCAYGFYPSITKFPLKAGPGGIR